MSPHSLQWAQCVMCTASSRLAVSIARKAARSMFPFRRRNPTSESGWAFWGTAPPPQRHDPHRFSHLATIDPNPAGSDRPALVDDRPEKVAEEACGMTAPRLLTVVRVANVLTNADDSSHFHVDLRGCVDRLMRLLGHEWRSASRESVPPIAAVQTGVLTVE